jgi:hypothetical protein
MEFTKNRLSVLNKKDLEKFIPNSKIKTKKEIIDCILSNMNNTSINNKIKKLKNVTFVPNKYLQGLSNEKQKIKIREINKQKIYNSTDKTIFKPSKTDFSRNKKIKTKTSKYTTQFQKLYPNAKSLKSKSQVTGIPLQILNQVYKKGLAAWSSSKHRPGTTQSQWGFSRVMSFIMKGCTFYHPDNKLVEESMKKSEKSKKFWNSIHCNCKKYC